MAPPPCFAPRLVFRTCLGHADRASSTYIGKAFLRFFEQRQMDVLGQSSTYLIQRDYVVGPDGHRGFH